MYFGLDPVSSDIISRQIGFVLNNKNPNYGAIAIGETNSFFNVFARTLTRADNWLRANSLNILETQRFVWEFTQHYLVPSSESNGYIMDDTLRQLDLKVDKIVVNLGNDMQSRVMQADYQKLKAIRNFQTPSESEKATDKIMDDTIRNAFDESERRNKGS